MISKKSLLRVTHQRQVACPPIESNKHLARTTKRIRSRTPRQKPYYLTRRSRKLNANRNFEAREPVRVAHSETIAEIRSEIPNAPVTSISGLVQFSPAPQEKLIASSNSIQSAGSSSDVTGIASFSSQTREQYEYPAIDMGSRKERREASKELREYIRTSYRPAQAQVQQTAEKPVQGMAIASLVLGIVGIVAYLVLLAAIL